MNPFKKKRQVLSALKDIKVNDRDIECTKCGKKHRQSELREVFYVCPSCGHHMSVTAPFRIRTLLDPKSFREICKGLSAENPLNFPGYGEKIKEMQKKTGLKEAVVCGTGKIDGHKSVFCFMDSRFMMASMGTVVGEKITRSFEYAAKKNLPVIIFAASGGARMQEGILALFQMAKTCAAVKKHADKGLLYISVMTNPTTGGTTASFASVADITLAEPGALIGFAGPRVIEQTIGEKLPEGFQRAEYLMEHGFVDAVVPRTEMRETLSRLLSIHEEKKRW